MTIDWNAYTSSAGFDELIDASGAPRPAARALLAYLQSLTADELDLRRRAAEGAIREMGVTFTVYSEGENIDRAWPFDIIPRVIDAEHWRRTAAGLKQRLSALNLFIDDLYNDQRILKDGVVPRSLIEESANFRPECRGVSPRFGAWSHVCGTDLVRDDDGEFYVLEDNLRVPSGVSYMLENRAISKRVLADIFQSQHVEPVDNYPAQLFDTLASLSPRPLDKPVIAVLTPGIYNSAYFEHAYLAQQMGAELVEGTDLLVDDDDCVYMKTIDGPARVDVIYRRIDDLFLDPEAFRPDSMLGVPGLMRAWRAGNVALANAPGAGVADDKVIYAYVPAIIRYYLDQDPLVPNVETFICLDEKQREHALANLDKLVVKPANESGGYGMLIGPHASEAERETFAERIRANPRNYIAQKTLNLSTAPTLVDTGVVEPRHLDLRPFVLQSEHQFVTTGGLTRVAMRKGSLVVNSSQGGGSKDTWILSCEEPR
ncbi:MAG: circularly permuted type 2 ATP-grasp protein [Pseudomonadota bacterium]